MGLLPPGINMPCAEIFSFFGPGKSETPRGGAPPQFITQQDPDSKPRFQGRFRDFSAAPLLTPWSSSNRRFLVPMMAVSPLNRTLI
jgi:hypothetical protein